MKKNFKIKLIAVLLLMATLLASCKEPAETQPSHEHMWSDATCSTPKTCTGCGATEGEVLAHDFAEATFFTPKTCKMCGATEGERLDSPIPEHLNLALQIDKIPVATADMTEQQLRDLIVDFMYLQINFAYSPTFTGMDEYRYYIKNRAASYGFEGCRIPFEEGKFYGGIPYVGNAAGSLYRWLEFYDAETGEMNWDPLIRTRRKNWLDEETGTVYPDVGSAIFGNSCAASTVWSWMRVTNEINSFWTSTWLPKNGFVKVGEYDIPGDKHGSSTKNICKANGTETMFAAYAQLKKADGLVYTGHAFMSVSDAVVVYDSDGNIDGSKSYILIAEQTGEFLTSSPANGGTELYSPLNDKGITYRIQGNFAGNKVNGRVKTMKKTFQSLYNAGSLPFTIPELCGQAEVEKAEAGLYKSADLYTAATVKVKDLDDLIVRSNYAISDIHFIIRDENGNELFNSMYAKLGNNVSTLKYYALTSALSENELYENKGCIRIAVSEYAVGGKNTLEITARVSTGELLTVYKGTLTE